MFGNLKEQIKEAQAEMKQKLEEMEIAGEADGGKVKVLVNGNRKMKSVTLAPGLTAEKSEEEIQNLILEASNQALNEAEKISEDEMMNSAKGMLPNIPGLF